MGIRGAGEVTGDGEGKTPSPPPSGEVTRPRDTHLGARCARREWIVSLSYSLCRDATTSSPLGRCAGFCCCYGRINHVDSLCQSLLKNRAHSRSDPTASLLTDGHELVVHGRRQPNHDRHRPPIGVSVCNLHIVNIIIAGVVVKP